MIRAGLIVLLVVVLLLVGLLIAGHVYTDREVARIEKRHPPTGQFVTVDGVRLHYTRQGAGDGPTVLLLHGASTSLMDFAASLTPPLARHLAVVAFDRPGYGWSTRPPGPWVDPARQAALVGAALDRLGIGQVVVVGHSLGGAVALALALDQPARTDGVVLLGGAAYPWTRGVAWPNHVAGVPGLGALFAHSVVVPAAGVRLEAGIAEVFEPNRVPPDYIERTAVRLAIRPDAFRASAEDVLRLSPYLAGQSRRYAELQMPMLLITGADDGVVPAWNHTDRLEQLLSQVQVVRFTGTGHAPHHVHTGKVVTLIARFAAQAASGTGSARTNSR